MTVEDAIRMMGVLESLSDGTPVWVERIERLNRVLLETPEQFFDVLWDQLNPIQEETKELFHSGKITPGTTFGEILKKGDDAQ